MAFCISSMRSAFSGRNVAFSSNKVSTTIRPVSVVVQAKKVCDLTGKKRNKAHVVTFSNKKHRKWQEPNLQDKRVYWESGQRWVKLTICTKAMKTLEKNGIDSMASEAGIDLWKLPFTDARPARVQYLLDNKGKVPVAKDPRAMKNPVRIAASKKQPKYPVYEQSGRIIIIKPGQEELVFGKPEEEVVQVAAPPAELNITVSE